VDLGCKLDIIDKAGAWFNVGNQRIQGRDAVKNYLMENPELCDQIEKQIRDNAHKLMGTQAARAAVANGRLADTAVVEGTAAVDVSAEEFEEG
jgi:recombination protein RecA